MARKKVVKDKVEVKDKVKVEGKVKAEELGREMVVVADKTNPYEELKELVLRVKEALDINKLDKNVALYLFDKYIKK